MPNILQLSMPETIRGIIKLTVYAISFMHNISLKSNVLMNIQIHIFRVLQNYVIYHS